jgi:hypothetical protein
LFLRLARLERLGLATEQHRAGGRGGRVDHVVDRCRGRGDADGQDLLTEQCIHEGRLAVVELAEDDEVEPLGFELGNAGGTDVIGQRHHADGFGDFGELLEALDDLALGGFVVLEQNHDRLLRTR